MSNHPIIHIELASKDNVATGKFYSDLFGWPVQQVPEMNYATFETGSVGGGFMTVSEDNPPGKVTFYVSTDDIDASLAKAESLGGKTMMGKTEIPGVGWFAFFSDPTGNSIGLMTPLNPAAPRPTM